VLELLAYLFLGSANHTADDVQSPGKLPALAIDSVREFAKPECGVDLMKLESPLGANSLPARDGSAAAKAAQQELTRSAKSARSPVVSLPGARSGWRQSDRIFPISA
jgi:tagatose-1,6-bisphosphate aldolase